MYYYIYRITRAINYNNNSNNNITKVYRINNNGGFFLICIHFFFFFLLISAQDTGEAYIIPERNNGVKRRVTPAAWRPYANMAGDRIVLIIIFVKTSND